MVLDAEDLDTAEAVLEDIGDDNRRERARQRLRLQRDRSQRQSNRDRLENARKALYRGAFDEAQEYLDAINDTRGNYRSQALNLGETVSDYSRLEGLLAAADWQGADRWMQTKLQQFARDRLSCRDLRLLERLWNTYSNGEHGLRVQLRYKREAGILGQTHLSIEQRDILDSIYPRRLVFGTTGASLDEALALCLEKI